MTKLIGIMALILSSVPFFLCLKRRNILLMFFNSSLLSNLSIINIMGDKKESSCRVIQWILYKFYALEVLL